MVSPFSKVNFVDHSVTDQSSILRFVEDNWGLPRIVGSFDTEAGPLTGMFDFKNPLRALVNSSPFPLDPATSRPLFG